MESPCKNILVVEDDDINRKLVRVVLGSKHYCIHEAQSVEEAMAFLVDGKPDLILLDIRLGSGSGLDVINSIRSSPEFMDIPVVAITAQAMKDDKSRMIAAGFDGYLSKPLDTRRLPEIVGRFIREGRGDEHA